MAKPEIRLKGFKGEWVADQAKQLFSTTNERNRPELPVLSANQDIRGMAPRTESGYTVSHNKANEVTYKVVKPGQYVIHLRSFQGGFAHSAVEGITSPAYTVFGFKDAGRHDDYFWKIIFMSKRFIKSLETITYGIRDGRSIGFGEFSEMKFRFPSRIEQQGIADYFKFLESMIQGVTKKIASLKQMKQACLVSMFPQTGETTPRVRFKGFKGEWNKDKAGNLFMTFNERNRPDLPVLSANQDIRGMAPRTDTGYNISHNKANEITYKVVKPGQYVIHLRSFQGGFAHSDVEGITSPAYTVFGFKDGSRHDDYFWKIIFMSKEFIKSLETITYGIRDGRSISFSEFAEMSFLFPSKEEQLQIASFFRSLDSQISLQEQRLEKLKQIKSACLDKMFV